MTQNTKDKVKQYFRDCFDKQLLIKKAIIAGSALVLVLIFSLSFYFWLKPMAPTTPDTIAYPFPKNGFWYIAITWNTGVAFGGMKNNLAGIMALQSFVFILLVALFLLVAKDNISSAFIACAMFGGLFNLIQRGCTPNLGVLDYFKFGFWESFAIFNWPDMFVVIGIFGFIIAYIVYLFKTPDDEAEQKQEIVKVGPQSGAPTDSVVTHA